MFFPPIACHDADCGASVLYCYPLNQTTSAPSPSRRPTSSDGGNAENDLEVAVADGGADADGGEDAAEHHAAVPLVEVLYLGNAADWPSSLCTLPLAGKQQQWR